MEKLTPAQRITKVIDYSGMTYSSFARHIKRDSAQYLRDIAYGKTKTISHEVAEEICKAYPEIEYEWLKNGTGEMLVSDNQRIINERKSNFVDLNINQQLLTIKKHLDKVEENQIKIIKNQETLLEKQQKHRSISRSNNQFLKAIYNHLGILDPDIDKIQEDDTSPEKLKN